MQVLAFVLLAYLTMEEGSDGEVPGGVGGHDQAQKGPYPVVVEGGDEHCGGTASSKNISPSPLIQLVVDVVYVAAVTGEYEEWFTTTSTSYLHFYHLFNCRKKVEKKHSYLAQAMS